MDHQLFQDEDDYFISAKELQQLASKKECRVTVGAGVLVNLVCLVLLVTILVTTLDTSLHSLLDVWLLGNLLPLVYVPLVSCHQILARTLGKGPIWRTLHFMFLVYTLLWFVLGHFCVYQAEESPVKFLGRLMLGLYYTVLTSLFCLLGAAFCIGSLVNK